MKSFDDALAPDPRQAIFVFDDPELGLRPTTFRDHHALVAALEPPATISAPWVKIYDRALNCLLYSWFDYDLAIVAVGQALAVVEFALKEELGARKLAHGHGLKSRLEAAVRAGVVRKPLRGPASQWPDTYSLLSSVRNEIAHGTDNVLDPNTAIVVFEACTALLAEIHGATLSPPLTT